MRYWYRLRADWGYKLLSLLLAALLWVFVLSEQNPFRVEQFSLELRAINVASGLVPVDLPRQVTVLLRAPREILSRMRPENLRAYVDARGLSAGQHSLPVFVDTPQGQGVQIKDWEPKAVLVLLDEWVQRTVGVEIRVVGTPPAEYTYEPGPAVTPEEVLVKGPSREVLQVWRAHGEVDISGARQDVQRKVLVWPLDLGGRQVENVTLEPVEVEVRVRVTRKMVTRTVRIVPRVEGAPAQGFQVGEVTVTPVTVSVRGDPDAMAGIDHVDTHPVDVSQATATLRRGVALDLAPGVQLLDGQEFRARVSVEIRPAPAPPPSAPEPVPDRRAEEPEPIVPPEDRESGGTGPERGSGP